MTLELKSEALCLPSDPDQFEFETTAELEPQYRIIGQPRGVKAIEFGIRVPSPGYNIFVMGESGTGRTTAIERFIEELAKTLPVPDDWVYVHNFDKPQYPIALRLPSGRGTELRSDLENLLERLLTVIPRAFDSEAYREEVHKLEQDVSATRDDELNQLQEKVREKGGALIAVPEGLQIIPAKDEKALSPEQFAAMPPDEQDQWREVSHELDHELEETMHRLRDFEGQARESLQDLVRKVASSVVLLALEPLKQNYQAQDEVVDYLQHVQEDIIEHVAFFQEEPPSEAGNIPPEIKFRRYQVNVMVDHSKSVGAPVILENNPTVLRLLGRVEHEAGFGGAISTDFTLIRGGALQAANGGFLVLRARDLFSEPRAWDALKRALIGSSACPEDPATRGGAATLSLDPEPIPINIKVILVGPPEVYFTLYSSDEDFRTSFKVVADFGDRMDRTRENELEYATFIATRILEEDLLPLDRTAVSRVIEQGSRLAGSQRKLSTRFGEIADLVREGSYWAKEAGREVVSSKDILNAVKQRIFYQGRIGAQLRERILDGTLLIATSGEVVGQANSLTVTQVGEYVFGQPSRVTARTFMGKDGVVQIDREVNLAGPIHNKGLMTLIGYLGGTYALDHPLSLTAQISFEQSYGGIEGDSASAAELFVLLSSLSEVPLKQEIALTGSINQRGEIQAIGGVSDKVESWFKLCQEIGFTGHQGVILPATNVDDLMLDESIRQAVDQGKFHVWAINHIDEGLQILTGKPADEIHQAVQARLLKLAIGIEKFGRAEESK
jgi:predicted ATP-dependent protease